MAYKASIARRSFEQEIKNYRLVLRQTDFHVTEPRIRQYVVSAAVFLGHASFENFIKDLFDIFAKSFSASGVQAKCIPDDLKMFVFSKSANLEKHYANYHANGDERRLLQNLASLLTNPSKTVLNSNDQAPAMSGKTILGNKAYPSTENLERVFSRIGIPNIFAATTVILKTDSELLLKGLADKRTELAHSAVMPGTSAKDIRDDLKKLARFVAAIDRISYNHVAKHLGQANWYITAT